nr:metallophosphoesterase [Bradyrhizobium hereditatis]
MGHVRPPSRAHAGLGPASDAVRPDYDGLIVAGDVVPRAERGVRWLLDRMTDRPHIYLMGNHEGYGTTWEGRLRRPGLRLTECTCTLRRTRPSASAMSRSRVRPSGRTSASTATRIAR